MPLSALKVCTGPKLKLYYDQGNYKRGLILSAFTTTFLKVSLSCLCRITTRDIYLELYVGVAYLSSCTVTSDEIYQLLLHSVWSISGLNWNIIWYQSFISAFCLAVYSDLSILFHWEFEAFLCKAYWLTFRLFSPIAHHLRSHWRVVASLNLSTWIWTVVQCSILYMCCHVTGCSKAPRVQYLVRANHLDLILVLS